MQIALNRTRGVARGQRTPSSPSLHRVWMFAGASLALLARQARADENWRVDAGPAVVVAPQYPGSRGELTLPLPFVDIDYSRCLFLNTNHGVGAYVVNQENLQVGSSLWFRRGRFHDESRRIADLDDIPTAPQAQLFARYRLGPIVLGTTLARDFGGSSGLTIDTTVAWQLNLSSRTQVAVGAQASYGNSRYMQAWFGITPQQARASGLSEYSPGAGFASVGPTASLSYTLSQRWTFSARVAENLLTSKASDSPLVERNALPTIAIGAAYHFLP
jgi:outer membrane protein